VEFRFERIESLPRLAWCAMLERGALAARLWHGPWLETGDGWFVDGAWSGPFGERAFAESGEFAGTGGRAGAGGLLFSTPTNTLERIFSVLRGDRLLLSCSLPLLLERSGLGLDPGYPFYRSDLWSVILGLRRCRRSIPTREGVPVRIHYFANLRVGPSLDLREEPKRPPRGWSGFAAYRAHLATAMRATLGNAADPSRKVRYEPLASVSSGYDSPACAALAAEAGCRRGVTFRTGIRYMDRGEHADDCGEGIGRRLGLTMKIFERDDRWRPSARAASEFAADGDGFDLKMGMWEGDLGRTLLVTGTRGGTAWNLHPLHPSPWQHARDPSGTSLGEWRRRVGFLHLAPATFAAGAERSLRVLSGSEEMRPYRVGGAYDRPIPRRILEEAGIPRGSFAGHKMGSFMTLSFRRREPPRFREIGERYERLLGAMPRDARFRLWLRHRAGHLLAKLERSGLGRWFTMPGPCDFPVPGPATAVVPWGVSALLDAYAECFSAGGPSAPSR
jgi:hypothetical protein